MDPFSSAKMMYAAASANQQKDAMKQRMSGMFRRGKRDKEEPGSVDKKPGDPNAEDGAEDVEELSGFNAKDSLWKGGCVMGALATIGTNMFTWVAFGGPLHIIGGTAATVAATVVAYNEVTMDDINTVRKAAQLLREGVNALAVQNTRLTGEIDRLEQQVFMLKETEGRLKDMTGQQDLNVKYLVSLVATNKEILTERQKLVRQDVVTDVTRMVLKADKDESGDFDEDEIKRLIKYIEELPSVKVNVKLLNKALKKNKSVGSIIDIVNDLARDDIPDKKRVFTYNFEDEKLIETLQKKKKKAKEESDEKKKKRAEKKKSKSSTSLSSDKSSKSVTSSKSSKSLKSSARAKSPTRSTSKKKEIAELESKVSLSDSESSEISSKRKTKKKSKSEFGLDTSERSSTKPPSKSSRSVKSAKSAPSLKKTLEAGEKKKSSSRKKSKGDDDDDSVVSSKSSKSVPPMSSKLRKSRRADKDDESVTSTRSKSKGTSSLEGSERKKRSSSLDAASKKKERSSSLGPLDDKRRRKRDTLSKSSHSKSSRPGRSSSSGRKRSSKDDEEEKKGLLGSKGGPLGLGLASKMKKSISKKGSSDADSV